MVKGLWRSFGASVRGPGHVRASLPNQDAFCSNSYFWGSVIVVSDGVGSCSTSEYGAKAACRAVCLVAKKQGAAVVDTSFLIEEIHKKWLKVIEPFKPETSSATCLFAICPISSPITLGMLGDGLAAVLKSDGSYIELCEDKNDGFSNQTGALSFKNLPEQWKTLTFDPKDCSAILLCTDGVADDLLPAQRENFVRHIFEQGHMCSIGSARRAVRRMLEDWPVPKHSDDKTLVCIYRNEE